MELANMDQSETLMDFTDKKNLLSQLSRFSSDCSHVIDNLSNYGKYLQKINPSDKLNTEEFDQNKSELFFQMDSKMRRLRAQFFGSYKSLNEHTWSILTELYLCDLSRVSVSIKHACLMTDLPATTALRWIGALEEEALIYRVQDRADKRRQFLRISESCRVKLFEFSECWFKQSRLVPEQQDDLLRLVPAKI